MSLSTAAIAFLVLSSSSGADESIKKQVLRFFPQADVDKDGVILNELVPHKEYQKSRLAVKQQEALLEMITSDGSDRNKEIAVFIQILQELQKAGNNTTFLPSLHELINGIQLLKTNPKSNSLALLNGGGEKHA